MAVALLELPQPYDFALSTLRYRSFGIDVANLWEDDALYRAVGGREVRIRAAPGGIDVEPLDAETEPVALRLLGVGFDLEGFYGFAAGDEVLAELVPRFAGLRPPVAPDPFESLVTSITAQQVSLYSAFAVRSRFVALIGEPVGRMYAFPTRERVARTSVDEIRAVGFSQRKAEYVVGLAHSELDLHGLAALPDDEVKARLTALPGIGDWTADWFLARHLARPQAWPAGDLGVRKAVGRFCAGGRMPSIEETRALGERFAPFQNLSAHYLLAALLTLGT
jgi:DNA-3-methyladenine glycosylase II